MFADIFSENIFADTNICNRPKSVDNWDKSIYWWGPAENNRFEIYFKVLREKFFLFAH